jgi:phage terminase large subunit
MRNYGKDMKNQKTLKIQTTRVFQDLISTNKRICVFQGSSRASKTYNILIYWIYRLLQEDNMVLSIVRKTLPALKGSVLRDLKELLIKFGVYEPEKWHSVDGYFELGTNIIEWFSVDDETKLRGRKRDYLFINEATEVTHDEYIQLALRTSDRIVIDLNPSLWNSWIYDLEGQSDVFYTIVTYKDNPFLSETLINEIEKLRDTGDNNLWRVFGEGQKGVPTRVVFSHQKLYKDLPYGSKLLAYGVDFGYNDPTTLIAVYKLGDAIYCKELLYLKNATIPDLIYKIKDLGINLNDDFICDSANPQGIAELSRNGINAKSVKKDTILAGIDQIKRSQFYVHEDSKNIINELNSYVWKVDKNGNNLDEPEDKNNHCLDSIRYVLTMKVMRNSGVYVY